MVKQDNIKEVSTLFQNTTASLEVNDQKWICGSRSGYEVFYFEKPSRAFIWEGKINVEGMGKLGLVTDIDKDGNGYYISFDVSNGVVKIRAWGYNPANDKQNFIFNDIQSNLFTVNADRCFHFSLLRYGNYIEVSVDGTVKLTLIDYMYSGNFMGLYSASSKISLQDSIVKILPDPEEEYASQEEVQKNLNV